MKLALGTVQFGLDYGVANAGGRTSRDEVVRILECAKIAGIDTLDTAAAYGECEQVLGGVGVVGWKVISKAPPLPNDSVNGREWVLEHIRQSLKRLRIERLEGVLLHNAGDLLKTQGANIAAGLQQAKTEGLVGKVGYSIYSPQLLDELLTVMPPDLIQAPFNIFDQRLARSGWLDRLAGDGVEVHVRSIFLQGLLLMARDKRPAYFGQWRELWSRWDALVEGQGSSALSLCLGFVKTQPAISRIVVGVDNRIHLEQLLAIWKAAAAMDGADLFCDDPLLVEPSNWKLK